MADICPRCKQPDVVAEVHKARCLGCSALLDYGPNGTFTIATQENLTVVAEHTPPDLTGAVLTASQPGTSQAHVQAEGGEPQAGIPGGTDLTAPEPAPDRDLAPEPPDEALPGAETAAHDPAEPADSDGLPQSGEAV